MKTSRKYNRLKLLVLIAVVAATTLSCSKLNSHLGMQADSTNEDGQDLSDLPLEAQRIIARAKERTQKYEHQAKQAEQELEAQKKEEAKRLALLQVRLAENMVQLGVPPKEAWKTAGLSFENDKDALLREVKEAGQIGYQQFLANVRSKSN